MTARELIKKYLAFFESRGHRVIPGASLIPENDPSALFTSAGMHPLVPFLMGEPHPAGNRLANVQKCLRTGDIDNVGDGFHHTFFLMLGNWSLGDYFKDEAIAMSFEFLTSPPPAGGLGIDPQKLYVSVFAGDENAPRDENSIKAWRNEFARVGIDARLANTDSGSTSSELRHSELVSESSRDRQILKRVQDDDPASGNLRDTRIFLFGKEENWWGPVGKTGPCGPDTEIFYDTGKEPCGPGCDPSCQCGRYIEIWNNVFMEYERRPKEKGQALGAPELGSRTPSEPSSKSLALGNSGSSTYKYVPLKQKNVDTGMGVARVTAVLNGFGDDDYQTELFTPIIKEIEKLSPSRHPERSKAKRRISSEKEILRSNSDKSELDLRMTRRLATSSATKSMRIVADHIRAAVFCIADGAAPSNTDRGYIVRRLIRRAIRHGHLLEINQPFLANVAQVVIENYKDLYPELEEQKNIILEELKAEEEQFGQTLKKGLKEFEKLVSDREENPPHSPTAGKTFEVSADLTSKVEEAVSPAEVGEPASPAGKSANSQITGAEAFNLYQTYGFPLELTKELAGEKNLTVDEVGFEKAFQDHQKKSRTASAKKFIGGLVNHSEIVTRYHTTTHLLHAALRQILGEHVQQQGSNITPERLRFDFSHPEKMTEEELKQVENIVNQKIKEDLPVEIETMSLEEAEKQGALAFFAQKYGNQVKVYSIGNFSKEVCGGPHIKSTGELGRFKIVKEKSIGRGTRRIRAVISGSE